MKNRSGVCGVIKPNTRTVALASEGKLQPPGVFAVVWRQPGLITASVTVQFVPV